jgi:hypothetical protein
MDSIWIVVIFFSTLFLILGTWFSVVLWTLKNEISPMPTTEKAKKKILAAIPRETQGIIIDLGSGWGSVAIRLAKLLPHCHVIGYETSPVPYLISVIWAWLSGYGNLRFFRKNFFQQDLGQAALIYCYLHPKAMVKLKKKFDDELRPGTIVISNTFAVPGWNPVQVIQQQDIYRTRIYLYVKRPHTIEKIHLRPQERAARK